MYIDDIFFYESECQQMYIYRLQIMLEIFEFIGMLYIGICIFIYCKLILIYNYFIL